MSAEKLRFDFSHFEKLTDDELKRVEDIVNREILQCRDIVCFETDINDAKKRGATALFGEKYGQTVRVVQVDDFSMELCGGCHLSNTGHAGLFKILSENGVAAGVRRIEAVTGRKAVELVANMQEMLYSAADIAKTTPELLGAKIKDLMDGNAKLQKELAQIKKESSKNAAEELFSLKKEINGVQCICGNADDSDMNELRELADQLRDKLGSGIVFLVSVKEGKGFMLAAATKDVVKNGFHCGSFLKETAKKLGSGGGGRPDMAQAGLKALRKPHSLRNRRNDFARDVVKLL